jgi:hypothetical protein
MLAQCFSTSSMASMMVRQCLGMSPILPRLTCFVTTAAWQTSVYWFMGALTNNGRKLANFAGFYKGIQSAGAAIMFRIDSRNAPYMNEFASCWALLAGSLVIAAPLIWMKIQDHVTLEEDLRFSDETIEEVAPTVAPEVMHEKA